MTTAKVVNRPPIIMSRAPNRMISSTHATAP